MLSGHLKRYYDTLKNIMRPSIHYFRQGWKAGMMKTYLKHYLHHLVRSIHLFGFTLAKEHKDFGCFNGQRMSRLKHIVSGLHRLLPEDSRFSYSILMPVYRPSFSDLQVAMIAALEQTASDPCFELLIGLQDSLSSEIEQFIQNCQAKYPGRLHVIRMEVCSFAASLEQLVAASQGNFLLLLRQEEWLRPDFLYRCEQLLRALPGGVETTCLYTDEMGITGWDDPIPGSRRKKASLNMPYLFQNSVGRSLLVPRSLWLAAGGVPEGVNQEIAEWSLVLKLDLLGAHFIHLPFPLYGRRSMPLPKELTAACFSSLLPHLHAYTTAKKLDWHWQIGDIPGTFKGMPQVSDFPRIQAVIPFKEQKEMTLKTIKSLKRQRGVNLCITAVDTESQDLSIGQEIEALGGEVLRIAEPFNYSRLNNLAVQGSRFAAEVEWVLFINNDVELEETALLEMGRWMREPQIGMVGCHLSYPNGLLQHGGIAREKNLFPDHMGWTHREAHYPYSSQREARTLGVVDAVTAACVLMQRKIFWEVGGFDEIWYPIAYSDTHLAFKLRKKNYLAFYTPYARGIHHESLSRQYENLEDVEASPWMHEFLKQVLNSHLKDAAPFPNP